jgi:hypothetical protein
LLFGSVAAGVSTRGDGMNSLAVGVSFATGLLQDVYNAERRTIRCKPLHNMEIIVIVLNRDVKFPAGWQ